MPAWLCIGLGSYFINTRPENITYPLIKVLVTLPSGLLLTIGLLLLAADHWKIPGEIGLLTHVLFKNHVRFYHNSSTASGLGIGKPSPTILSSRMHTQMK